MDGERGYAILTGLSFALVGYARWQLLLPATFVEVIYALFHAGDWLPRKKWHVAGRLILAVIVASVALLPPLMLLLNQQSQGNAATDLLREGEETVLNLPIDPLRSKVYMFQQLQHGRPILQGKIARVPDDAHTYIDQNPWLSSLRVNQEMDPDLTDVSRQLAYLTEDRVRYILLHRKLVGSDRIAHWQRYLLAQPRYQDNRLIVYATQPEAGRDFDLSDELVPGLGPVSTIVSADCLQPDRILEVDVGWGTTRALSRDFDVEIALVDEEGGAQQSQTFPLADWPTHQWPADALVWGYYPLRLSPTLPEGTYTVQLTVLDAETDSSPGTSSPIQTLRVQSSPCPIPADANASPGTVVTNVTFGDDLRLLSYRIERDGLTLFLTLHWRAQRRMPLNYKIFIHVYDPANDIPITQDDAEPHRGGYPTRFWTPGEVVEDRTPVSLDEVPPGEYGIAIGVYDPSTLERLTVVDAHGQTSPDGRLILPETIEVVPP